MTKIDTEGIAGSRTGVWAIKLLAPNRYRLLTQEEQEYWNNLINNALDTTEKRQEFINIQEAFENTDMTKEQYLENLKKHGFNFYEDVVKQFNNYYNVIIVHINKYDIDAI